MNRERLTMNAISDGLRELPGWECYGSCLRKTFTFASYMDGIDFVQRMAVEAEAMNHHPDLVVGWRKVGVSLSTHSAGGVTALDLELSKRIESLQA